MRPVAILALLASLAACTPTYTPAPRSDRAEAESKGPCGGTTPCAFLPPDGPTTSSGNEADTLAHSVFVNGGPCGPDCFETFERSGCDYDCRKKETLR